ncbi:MAG: DUF309 domain-containing protein [Leptospiraceae bacterium]|nr:DUF309 domain-containing protein [Leptospiraceae bacterium]
MNLTDKLKNILEVIQATKDAKSTRIFAIDSGMEYYLNKNFFEAHEVWEFQWKKEVGPKKLYLQAMIQISVSMNKIFVNPNLVGANSLLEKSINKLLLIQDSDELTEFGKKFSLSLLEEIQLIQKKILANEEQEVIPPKLQFHEVFIE